jgi:cytochrome c oxidase accessory protein FixG
MKLDKGPMTGRKFALKAIKHTLWILIAVWSGFTLVAYFTPVDELLAALPFDLSGWELFWTFFYAGFFYMQAGFLREQVCKYMCPYARFQGVMFDPDTLVITYDPERGEPRGARKKGVDAKASGLGDCVDCGLCVVVCPTGIDIRNGQQYECIGCGACIDACDPVMDKVGLPRGLIRYTTENALAKHWSTKESSGISSVRASFSIRPSWWRSPSRRPGRWQPGFRSRSMSPATVPCWHARLTTDVSKMSTTSR